MRLEDVFSSKGRVKVLRVLVQIGELNASEISRRTKLNYAIVKGHLTALEKAGLVRHKSYGRIRIYRLNETDARAEAIKHLIEVWQQTK